MAPERPDLLGKARLLTPLRHDETYAWISPEELLILRPTLDVSGPYKQEWDRSIPATAHHLQISTREESPLDTFNQVHQNALIAQVGVSYSHGSDVPTSMGQFAPFAALSPNGQYLLWTTPQGLRVASLDGRETINGPRINLGPVDRGSGGLANPIWLPDSRSWLEVGSDNSLLRRPITLRRMDQIEESQTAFVLGWQDGYICGLTTNNTVLVQCPEPWGRVTDKLRWAGEVPTQTTFLEVEPVGRYRMARRFRLCLPTAGIVGHTNHRQVVVSPDGRRLAWLIQEPRGDNHHTPRVYFPWTSEQSVYSLWTTDLVGHDACEIGVTHLPPEQPGESVASESTDQNESIGDHRVYVPHDLQWSPDGGQISFTYGDNLYAVPV
jgi:hypothetical protein